MSTASGVSALPSRSRNRRGEGGRLREEILDAAVELLKQTGDEQALTLRAVARQVGIAAPSIYAHFADRQAIMLAVVQRAFVELEGRLHVALDAAAPVPGERLRAICDAYLEFAQTRSHQYRLMFDGLWDVDRALESEALTRNDVQDLGRGAISMLADALSACVAAGESTSTDPHADTVALWVGLHGLAHQRTASSAFPWPADIVDRIVLPLARLRPAAK